MQLTKSSAERRLGDLLMEDMPVMEITARNTPSPSDWFAKYKKLRREFLKSLTDSIEELSFLNLSQEAFMGLIMGRSLPENLSLRLRTPMQYGGKLEIENMFMCRTFPHSHNLDRFIIEQSGSPTIWVPNPAKKIYIPAYLLSGAEGGNATTDRLTQMAAQFAQMNHGME